MHNEQIAALRANRLPSEYHEGEWRLPSQQEAWGYVTYTEEPSPETGHAGWCWWALGKMGDAPTYETARAAVEREIRAADERLMRSMRP